jgi:hypothetical protein
MMILGLYFFDNFYCSAIAPWNEKHRISSKFLEIKSLSMFLFLEIKLLSLNFLSVKHLNERIWI